MQGGHGARSDDQRLDGLDLFHHRDKESDAAPHVERHAEEHCHQQQIHAAI